MDLHYWEKQLILYTKNKFGRIDYNKDLKHFPANLYGLGIENTDPYNVFRMVVRLYQNLVDNGFIKFSLEEFIIDVFKRSSRERSKYSEANYEDFIRQMLGEIQGISVSDERLDLGETDQKLLQLIKLDMKDVL